MLKGNKYIKKFNNFNIKPKLRISKISEDKSYIDSFKDIGLYSDSIDESLNDKLKNAKKIASNIIKAFKSETKETGQMMSVFNRQLRSKLNLNNRSDSPSEKEISDALVQLKDIPKLAPYAIILLLSPIPLSSTMYTSLAFYLNKKSRGKINLLPSSFDNVFDIKKSNDDKTS